VLQDERLEPYVANPAPIDVQVGESTTAIATLDSAEKPLLTEEVGIHQQIIHATRSWIQYGTVGFSVLCIVIGAVEALFGR
jgi:hypothetical protein